MVGMRIADNNKKNKYHSGKMIFLVFINFFIQFLHFSFAYKNSIRYRETFINDFITSGSPPTCCC